MRDISLHWIRDKKIKKSCRKCNFIHGWLRLIWMCLLWTTTYSSLRLGRLTKASALIEVSLLLPRFLKHRKKTSVNIWGISSKWKQQLYFSHAKIFLKTPIVFIPAVKEKKYVCWRSGFWSMAAITSTVWQTASSVHTSENTAVHKSSQPSRRTRINTVDTEWLSPGSLSKHDPQTIHLQQSICTLG